MRIMGMTAKRQIRHLIERAIWGLERGEDRRQVIDELYYDIISILEVAK